MKSSQFPTFFEALHKRQPFPWQVTLAERVCSEGWPDVIDLPTASGKTACIDIALFAMAVTNAAPRRVFFVVDRRVIVNEAFERANKIAGKLAEAKHGVLAEVAARLRELARGPDPLQVCELRGGIYRDASWVRNPLQPLVVTSTVDQTGSRLLFRGYGVSESSAPIHAGLIANDAILFLDEAHSSRAFAQTLTSISKYRSGAWAEQPLLSPFAFVEMTATPSRRSEDPFRLGEADRENEVLKKRLRTPKPTRLVTSKGAVEKTLVEEFLSLVGEAGQIRSGAIMVNRVSTARRTHALLMEQGRAAELVIGRMRPLDRDDQMGRLDPIHSGKPRDGGPPVFVVSTQCLETGADLDFDVLVSECASIDALQQRFGRLDRLGEFGRAKGAIVIGANQVKPKQPDPIYGEALVLTWKLLQGLVSVNMGIEAAPEEPLTVAQRIRQLPEEEANALRRIGPDAPILLPSHVDAFSQTSPRPSVDPDPALFLHGPKEGSPDVQVVWRIDLKEGEEALWAAIVALCPPVSAEAMPVPIHEFRRWLAEEDQDPNASDLESAEDGSGLPGPAGRPILAWRGDKSKVVSDPRDLRPGDTLVIPISYEGWEALGHKPEQADPDLAERAYFVSRQKLRIRLHPDVIETWKATDSREALKGLLSADVGPDRNEILKALQDYQVEVGDDSLGWLAGVRKLKAREFRFIPYPQGTAKAFVFESRKRIAMEEDAGNDELSAADPAPLNDHIADVRKWVTVFCSRIADARLQSALEWAAEWHDAGKADVRFQALLRGDLLAARYAPTMLAKGERPRTGETHERFGLPDGFRHELLSLQMAERSGPPVFGRDLALHAIAAHHGYCRPFAPVVIDDKPEPVSYKGCSMNGDERRNARAPHRIDSGIAERFWELTRRYGWWGLAWLEAMLRLSDWAASGEKKDGAA